MEATIVQKEKHMIFSWRLGGKDFSKHKSKGKMWPKNKNKTIDKFDVKIVKVYISKIL